MDYSDEHSLQFKAPKIVPSKGLNSKVFILACDLLKNKADDMEYFIGTFFATSSLLMWIG
jgi:hypothetical protein